jgi:signal transduction histidine kinase
MQSKVSLARGGGSRRQAGWTFFLIPNRVALVTSAAYVSVPIFFWVYNVYAAHSSDPMLMWKEATIIGVTLLLLSIDRLEYWHFGDITPAGTAAALLITRIVFIEIIAQLDGFRFSVLLYLILPLIAVLYFGDWLGYAVAALAWIVYVVKHMLNTPGWLTNQYELQYFFIFMIGLIFTVTMAQLINRERTSRARAEHLLAQLAVSHQQLQDYTEQAVELAATKERNRMARDIHDSLGHYLTVINVQLEKAVALHDRYPEQEGQAVRDAKVLASEALQDVRRSVGTLRATQDTFSVHRALGTLIEYMQGNQLAIELHVEGREDGYAPESLRALYRAAQEGLTNIQKHAVATQVRIELQFGEEEATLYLSDNGKGFDLAVLQELAPGREGGYGLLGIRERLELISGRLQVESATGAGTLLSVSVPRVVSLHRGLGQCTQPEIPVSSKEAPDDTATGG